jgi:heptaprenyl diphosphate synthase
VFPLTAHRGGWTVRRVTRLGFLASLGTALFVLESLVPLPLPFMKVGFANISTLVALILSGPADALIVVFLRVLAGSLVTGSFLSPSFILAMAAGVVSAAVMGGVGAVAGETFGPVGVSLAGSTAHVSTQLGLVALLYVRSAAVIHIFPVLLITALAGGLVVGFITMRLLPALHAAADAGAGWIISRKLTPWDVLLGSVLCGCVAASFVALPSGEGSAVLVDVAGVTVEKLDLHEDRQIEVRGTTGTLRIEVRGGAVRVAEAGCPNRVCVRTGWRRREGEVIVCVPNNTVIRVMGSEHREVGGITG